MKDLFSEQSDFYARYRPSYPPELFDYLLRFVPGRSRAWDCATGNGQAAVMLAAHFEHVDATDISEAQLEKAVRRSNIHYQRGAAEQTNFADDSFDLITVATAYHWFNWKAFEREVRRVARKDAVIAVWAYNLIRSDDEAMNRLILHFYTDVVGAYWDPERKHVDDSYTHVLFDYEPLPPQDFQIDVTWTREAFTGYLHSWSAVQHYVQAKKTSPIALIQEDLDRLWPGNEQRDFHFSVFMKIGRIR